MTYETTTEAFRRRRCPRCKGTLCVHRSSFKASGRHFAKRGAQKARGKK